MAKRARKAATDAPARLELDFAPSSFDAESRTFEAVIATETPVKRWGFSEKLVCRRDAINAERMAGLPLIDAHNRGSVAALLGRMERYRFEAGLIIGTFRLADTARAREAAELIADGMIRKVSIAYSIEEVDETRQPAGGLLQTVTRWSPMEVSLVTVPADPNSNIRGAEMPRMIRKKPARPVEDDHDDDVATMAREHEDVSIREADETRDSRRDRAARARARQLDTLRSQAVDAGLAEDDVDAIFDEAPSITAARAAVMESLARRSRAAPVEPLRVERRSVDDARARAEDAIAIRLGATPALEGPNPFADRSVSGIIRGYAESVGVSTRTLSDRQMADWAIGVSVRGMHTTSDFVQLLLGAGERALMTRFGAQPNPLKRFSTQRNARDFRPQSFIRPGEAPKLERVLETGEVKSGTLSEEKAGLQVATYGGLFSMSRNAIINDDLGAFSDFLQAFAESAATTEGDEFFSLLSANAYGGKTLKDGKPWFHADHGNLAVAGAAPDVTTISAAREAMLMQKNVNGNGLAGAMPAVILVGPKRQTTAEALVATLAAATVADVNVFAGRLRVEVEPRYSGIGWWLFADPATRPAMMHGYLDGRDGPQLDSREGWGTLGMDFRCLLDFGCDVYDWRAAHFNPGTGG